MDLATLLPEWPRINSTRPALIGIRGGSDHPFGALLMIATERGLVVVDEYLERQQANLKHKNAIVAKFNTTRFSDLRWAVSDAEKDLRLEFSLADVPTIGVPSVQTFGVQRVQSWLLADQLYFASQQCPETIRQLKRYRYAQNTLPDGQKRQTETVFRADDELPTALAVAVLAWPELPKPTPAVLTDRERRRWESLDEGSRQDIERLKEYAAQVKGKDLDESDARFPVGDFFGTGTGSGDKLW